MARGRARTDSSASKQTKNVNSKKIPNEEQHQTLSKKLKAKQEAKTASKTGEQIYELRVIPQLWLNMQKVSFMNRKKLFPFTNQSQI